MKFKYIIRATSFRRISHIVTGLVCAIAYGYLAVHSRSPTGMDLVDLLAPYWFISTVVFIYWFWLYKSQIELNFWTVLAWAVVFRAIGIWGSPILEDDFYRFLLDGCVFFTYGSPYDITPSSLFVENSLSLPCAYVLNWVNNPDLPTIYAPVLQYVFFVSYLLSPANINVLQLIISLFDLAIIFLLRPFAPTRNILLYAWCPLVLKEFAFTAHPDIIGAFLVFAAFYARNRNNHSLAGIFIAFACCTKIFAVLALPFILYRQPLHVWGLTLITILLIYLPFLVQGQTDLAVLGLFALNWQFNSFLFEIFELLIDDFSARLICLGIFFAWYAHYCLKYFRGNHSTDMPRMDWIFGVFLLLSPVVNAWYLIWLLPFSVIRPSFSVWTASLVLSLSYVTGLHLPASDLRAYEVANLAWLIEVTCIGLAVVCDYLYQKKRPH